jgi:hypothetical protein
MDNLPATTTRPRVAIGCPYPAASTPYDQNIAVSFFAHNKSP